MIFQDEEVTTPSMYELCSFDIDTRLALMDICLIHRH